jgi:hypothetical protein
MRQPGNPVHQSPERPQVAEKVRLDAIAQPIPAGVARHLAVRVAFSHDRSLVSGQALVSGQSWNAQMIASEISLMKRSRNETVGI